MIYLDTSAVAKVLIDEEESRYVRALFTSADKEKVLVSSWLLYVEMHRIGRREQLDGADLDSVLGRVNLIDITEGVVISAAHLPCDARSLDAIHLATAQMLADSDVQLLTYDTAMAEAASEIGMDLVPI